jgi:hypothetical protein
MSQSFPNRVVINILAVVGAFYVIFLIYFYFIERDCAFEVTGLVISPNGEMQAKMTNYSCALEKEKIEILLGERRTNTGLLVFEAEVEADNGAPIHIAWDGNSKLRVTYPWGMQPQDGQPFSYEGVDISFYA